MSDRVLDDIFFSIPLMASEERKPPFSSVTFPECPLSLSFCSFQVETASSIATLVCCVTNVHPDPKRF